jgi:hypothetical protein
MHVPEIIEVKERLTELKSSGKILEWELPYENILTRRSAAIFFFTESTESSIPEIERSLSQFPDFAYRVNSEKKLSQLKFRVEFKKSTN